MQVGKGGVQQTLTQHLEKVTKQKLNYMLPNRSKSFRTLTEIIITNY